MKMLRVEEYLLYRSGQWITRIWRRGERPVASGGIPKRVLLQDSDFSNLERQRSRTSKRKGDAEKEMV